MTEPWHLFTGSAQPHHVTLPAPPPWRTFGVSEANKKMAPKPKADSLPMTNDRYWDRARSYHTPPAILDAVNAALMLRRPLLVTGKPGTGKSSLAYRVAYELGLGPVIVWPVNSRSTLKEGLYDYDAIARLQDRQLPGSDNVVDDIGRYITLRALGTALLPQARPRVLLIDELDKADPDLPNDLLNIFEEGWFDIPELQRHAKTEVTVRVTNPVQAETALPETTLRHGRVQCQEFPFVVMTSNGEREFPPAFLRRCIRVELADPSADQLTAIVRAHFGPEIATSAAARIAKFADSNGANTATDQLLNALFIVHQLNGVDEEAVDRVEQMLTKPLL